MIRALINGKWKQVSKEHLQIGDVSFAYKIGLYETFRTVDHKPVFLEKHLNRLFQSARSTNLLIHYSKPDLVNMVKIVISEFPDPDQRVRILAIPDHLILYSSSLDIDTSIYNGVNVITVVARRDLPKLKTTDYKTCLSAYRKAKENDCFEAILVDKSGSVYEGSRSNVFWVRNRILFTRKNMVLPGITRQTIISKSLIPVSFGKLFESDFTGIEELFITNSGSGVVPVTCVNGFVIGNGTAGKITRELLIKYDRWIHENAKSG